MFTAMFVFVTLIIWTKQLETCFFPGIYIYITVLTKFMFNNARTHRENKINLLYNVHVLIIIVTRWEKISFNHPCVCRLELSNPRCLTVSVNSPEPPFTDYSKATRVRKFVAAYCDSVIETFSYTFVSFNIL